MQHNIRIHITTNVPKILLYDQITMYKQKTIVHLKNYGKLLMMVSINKIPI